MIRGTVCPPRDSNIVPNSYEGLLPRRLSHAPFSLGPTLSAFFQSRSIFFAGTCDGNLLRNFARSCLRASERARAMADTTEPHADQSSACRIAAQWQCACGLGVRQPANEHQSAGGRV